VVANQALGGERLHDEVLLRVREGPCRFHVLVPVAYSAAGDACVDAEPATTATRRLDAALSMLHGFGVLATGDVVAAIADRAVAAVDAAHAVEHAGLAGAVRPDQREQLACFHRERDAVEHGEPAEAQRQALDGKLSHTISGCGGIA